MAISAVVGAVLLVGGVSAASQAHQARESRRSAQSIADNQMIQQQEQMAALDDQKKQYEEDQANAAAQISGNAQRDGAKARSRAASAANSNRSTINTSPIGVTGNAATAGKTLLGS
jgi:hypothetical protein